MTDLEALKKQLNELATSLQEAQNTLEPFEQQKQELKAAENSAYQKYKDEVANIRSKRAELDDKTFKIQSTLNNTKYEFNKLSAEIQEAERAEERKRKEQAELEAELNRIANLTSKFENAALGAPWREFAKNHQIEAGHKINLDRNVILADPMGLGKTLSAIITADLAEATTKEANPNRPLFGEEQEVWVPEQLYWTSAAVDAAWEGVSPFHDKGHYKGILIQADQPLKIFMDYDTKNRFEERGWLVRKSGHYENQIIGGIKRPVGKKVLYFCPAPLLRNVMEEWQQWAPHRNVLYLGTYTKDQQNFLFDNALAQLEEYVVILNFESWRRNRQLLDRLIQCEFDTVIIDEAHNIKDRKSIAFKGVKQVLDGLKPEFVIPMTGTPLLNRPQELFTLLHLVNPREFNHENDFLFKYCEQYGDPPKWKFRDGGLDRLAKQITNNFLRRTKHQAGIVLPEKTIIHHDLDVDAERYPLQAKARKHMKKHAAIIIDANEGKSIVAPAIIALFTRLRQIETWPAGIQQKDPITKEVVLKLDVEESQKVDYIIRHDPDSNEWEGLIPDNVEDERMVVFSQFKAPLHVLKERIEKAGYTATILDGDTSREQRDIIRHDFDRGRTPDRSSAKYDVLLCNYKAGGVGLNLTAATNMVILDEEWSPGKRDQAFDRIHRIGQSEAVTINVIRTVGTIDSWLADIIKEKENLVEGFEQATLDVQAFKEFLDDED